MELRARSVLRRVGSSPGQGVSATMPEVARVMVRAAMGAKLMVIPAVTQMAWTRGWMAARLAMGANPAGTAAEAMVMKCGVTETLFSVQTQAVSSWMMGPVAELKRAWILAALGSPPATPRI